MKLSFSSLGILALLSISIFSNLNVCQAEVVWSDDFNDGDFEEWSVSSGIWPVINGTLQGQTITEGSYCIINKTSTIAYGTWSFDVKLQNEKNLYLSFIDYNSTFATFGYYYELQIRPRTSSVRFNFYKVEGLYNTRKTFIDYTIYEELHSTWHHIDITRELDGKFSFYLDTILIFEVVNNNINTSDSFIFTSNQNGAYIDNIVVSDTVDIKPPTPLVIISELSETDVTQGDEVEITIHLEDDLGNPVESADIEVKVEEQIINISETNSGYYVGTIDTADLNGSFDIVVTAEKEGYTSATSNNVLSVIEAPLVGNIVISVKDEDGNSVSSVTVSSTSQPIGQENLNAVTNLNGDATFNDVIVGSYTILAQKTGYTSSSKTNSLSEGETKTIVIQIIRQISSIKIFVKDESANPISNADVTTTSQPSGQLTLIGKTSSDGSITFDDVKNGAYSFLASMTDYESNSVTISASLGEMTEKTILLSEEDQQNTNGGGIPGFPFESLVLSILLASVIMWMTKKNN